MLSIDEISELLMFALRRFVRKSDVYNYNRMSWFSYKLHEVTMYFFLNVEEPSVLAFGSWQLLAVGRWMVGKSVVRFLL